MFEFFKLIQREAFRKYFLEATDRDKIALKFKDVSIESLPGIERIIDQLEGRKEFYVLLWERCFGVEACATSKIPSLNFFEEGGRLTFQETERIFNEKLDFMQHVLSIDSGYRKLIILVEKTPSNLLKLKKLTLEKGGKIPPFYRKDLKKLEGALFETEKKS